MSAREGGNHIATWDFQFPRGDPHTVTDDRERNIYIYIEGEGEERERREKVPVACRYRVFQTNVSSGLRNDVTKM